MAEYRRKLIKGKQKQVLTRYKKHRDAEGGIFKPDKRRKLLGLKAKSRKVSPENLSNFWSDTRNTVKNGLSDLHLISDVANAEQMKKMFDLVSYQELNEDKSRSSLATIVKSVLDSPDGSKEFIINKQRKITHNKESPDAWKAFLAKEIIDQCLKFYESHGFVTSKAHQRLVEELKDMLNVEVARGLFLERGKRNVVF